MERLTYEIRDGKALWAGRTLAEWAALAVARVVDEFAPQRVLVFGSVARGEDGPDSDIDLLVVFDHIEGRRHDLGVVVQRSLRDIGAPVDVLVTDRNELRRRGRVPGVLRVALREGTVMHERAA